MTVSSNKLESPAAIEDLYTSRGEEVEPYRPTFTGDVYAIQDSSESRIVMVLQHPCALRTNGVHLASKILVAPVRPATVAPRSKMADESFKIYPLSQLTGPEEHFVADFAQVESLDSSDLLAGTRIAILSQEGVNLLLQRWVFHNSRVTISTESFNAASDAEFTEADLAADWIEERFDAGDTLADAEVSFHDWIRAPWNLKETPTQTRQILLRDQQKQSAVRKAMREHLKDQLTAAA